MRVKLYWSYLGIKRVNSYTITHYTSCTEFRNPQNPGFQPMYTYTYVVYTPSSFTVKVFTYIFYSRFPTLFTKLWPEIDLHGPLNLKIHYRSLKSSYLKSLKLVFKQICLFWPALRNIRVLIRSMVYNNMIFLKKQHGIKWFNLPKR